MTSFYFYYIYMSNSFERVSSIDVETGEVKGRGKTI